MPSQQSDSVAQGRRKRSRRGLQEEAQEEISDDPVQTESEEEIDDAAPLPTDDSSAALDSATLNGLDELRSHTSRFNFRSYPIKVFEMYQWYYTDTAKPSQLRIPEHYYQRDMTAGWGEERASKYLQTVFAGQAGTPFILNILRKDARVVDGGHRLNALLGFKKNEVGMKVGSKVVYFKQLSEDDQAHFDDQNLTILEYKGIPLKDEIDIYIMLNSGLPFSHGEKLAAMQQVNDIIRVSARLLKLDGVDDLLGSFCRILGKDTAGKHAGRKNELLVATFCAYTLHFRKARAAPVLASMQETFVHTVCELGANHDPAPAPAAGPAPQAPAPGPVAADTAAAGAVADLMHKALVLFNSLAAAAPALPGLRTDFRRMLVCMVAAAEIADPDPDRFAAFLRAAVQPGRGSGLGLRRLLTSAATLDAAAVGRIAAGYAALRAAQAAADG
jgi:hypothetical protein